jgi:plastocyanin
MAKKGVRISLTLVRALALAISVMTLSSIPALAATKSVSIKDIAYNPSSLSVHVGDKVTWTNNETGLYPPMHTVTSDDGHSFDSGYVDPGGSFSVTFNKPGTFAYHCNVHSSMHGTITVIGSATSPTPTPTHPRTKPTATATAKPTVVPVSPTPTSSVKPAPRVSKTVNPSTSPISSPSSSPSRVVAAGSSKSGTAGALAGVAGALIIVVGVGTFVLRRRRTNP